VKKGEIKDDPINPVRSIISSLFWKETKRARRSILHRRARFIATTPAA